MLNELIRMIHISLKLYFDLKKIDSKVFEEMLELIFIEFKKRCAMSEPFSLFAIYVYDNFDEMVAPLISNSPQRKVISFLFAKYKKG